MFNMTRYLILPSKGFWKYIKYIYWFRSEQNAYRTIH